MRPGALTALLGELARAPDATGWSIPAQPGERIGRFEILREIGRGGFGVVYEARDTELGRSVAFKAIHAGTTDATRELTLLAEAEAAARLAHPNIVHLYDVGRCGRGAFLIMELLRGETLDERIARGRPKPREAVRIATEIARGLAHAHEQGVVHRDLKPGNVFVCEDGQVKVLDFGLANIFGRGGLEGGTPAYMAPEQARGEPCDERADVYALGAMVHEVVTGARPFQDGERGIAEGGRAPELPGAPGALSKLVGRMLARDPAARPRSGVEVHEELARIRKSLEPRRLLWAGWALAVAALGVSAALALRATPLPHGRLLTALADAENTTGDADLDGVSELLRAGLEQSRRVAVMARSRLVNALRSAGAPVPPVIGEREVRAVAQSARAELIVVPAVRRTPAGFEIEVRAASVTGDFTAVEREGAASKLTLPEAVDRATRRLRKAVREEASDVPDKVVALADVAPATPDALRTYVEGIRLESEGLFAEALAAFRKSMEADREFPLARLAILEVGFDGEYLSIEEERAHRAVLRANLDRLPPNHRAYADFVLFHTGETTGDANFTEHLQRIDRFLEAWPEDPRMYANAGWPALYRGDLELARPYLERGLALAPLGPKDAIEWLLFLGRLDEALERARAWTAASPGSRSFAFLSYVHRHRGELPQALEAARRAVELGHPSPLTAFVDADAMEDMDAHLARMRSEPFWLALRGRVREALAQHDASLPPDAPLPLRSRHRFRRSFHLLPREDPGATWRETEALFQVGAGYFACHALQLGLLGDLERSWPLTWGQEHDHHLCYRLYMAVRLWRLGHREDALTELERIHAPSTHLYRGEILAELGRDREAVDGYRAYRRSRGPNGWDELFDAWNVPRSLYLEAVSLERMGEKEEAREVLRRLLRLWDRADRDLPLLAKARALEARLAADRRTPPPSAAR